MTTRTGYGRPCSAASAAGRGRPARSGHWARLIAQRYSLTLPEARAELRRLAAGGWMPWEFHTRFANDREDRTT